MVLTDQELIVGLREGNEMVFETIFKGYYERLCNYANTFVSDMAEAEEMVQSTFLGLWEKHENVEIHTSMKSYLYRAVHNHCLNRIKHYKVRQEHSEELQYQTEYSIDSASQELIGIELEQQINLAIGSLPPQCSKIFTLSRFENLTYAEIAEHLNLSVKTVDNQMGKALKILRERLKDYLPYLVWLFLFKN
ncbi:MAG TPA: RNA polymerase sigma-70 factor [Bacteroidales bacterium]